MHLKSVLRRLFPLGGSDEILRGRGIVFLAIRDSDYEGQRRGSERTNFQSWAGQTIETLLNQSHTPTGLDGCDEAGGTVVLFRNLRRTFQRREQGGEPRVVFGIVGQRISNEPFIGDLLQPDLAYPRQRMRRMHRDADGETMKLLENKSGQDFRRDLNQQGDVQLAVAQSVQHSLGGLVVKLNAHAWMRILKN